MATSETTINSPLKKDYLDLAVESYEKNVPLAGQIAAGFTLPGMGIEGLQAVKYGRDAVRDLQRGNLGQAGISAGIAGLTTLGIIPLFGELARPATKYLKSFKADFKDPIVDISQIERKKDAAGDVIRSEPERIDTAKMLLQNTEKGFSYKGVKLEPRQPIEVLQQQGGKYQQLGGKSTIEAMEDLGAKIAPIKIFNTVEDFNTYNFLRKQQKNTKRKQDAIKLQPKIGDPTFEGSLRQLGNALEKETKKTFNTFQQGFKSSDDVFNTALRTNQKFQTTMDDIAKKFGTVTGRNPVGGKSAKEIDPDTGFMTGEVKLKPRMEEKVAEKYNGDFSQITDAIRTRIIVDSVAQEDQIAKTIADMFPTIDGGRVLMKKSGYLDRKLNIQFTNDAGEKIIGEIALITAPMFKAADDMHPFYEKYRKKNFGMPDGSLSADIIEEGFRLEKVMKDIATNAQVKMPKEFLESVIERFYAGGAVVGKLGRLSPITPNIFVNSDFDSLEPSMKKSLTCPSDAFSQSPESDNTGIKNPNTPLDFSIGAITAGPLSQEKYTSLSSIQPILQKSAKNSKRDEEIFVVLDDE
jgi:hypothetical protein